ncbi:MAG: AAA family ATPase [Planctomycetota bacterium]
MTSMKSFRIEAATLRAAMQEAQRQFGRDVLIAGSEQTASGFVVTVQIPSAETQADALPRASTRRRRRDQPNEAIVEIPRPDPTRRRFSRGFAPLAERALSQGYPRTILEAVQFALRNTRIRLDREGDPALPRAAAQVLASLIPTTSLADQRTVAVVGPTGVGKTTTIAKLAAAADQRGESVAILTLDTYRVGAVEQLRAYADLLNVPCEVAFTPSDLARHLERFADRDRVFIDTTGRSPFDRKALDHLRAHLGRNPIATTLCLPASSRRVDAQRALEAFAPPTPSSMVLTKWDETDAPGEVLGLAIERKLPISHITVGQEVPEDIVPANRTSLALRAFELDRADAGVEVTR